MKQRFTRHLSEKSFWQKALVAQSRAESLSPAHVIHLERLCIQRAKEAGRFTIQNSHDGQKPALTKHLLAECEDLFDTSRLLLATLGLDLFSPSSSDTEPVYRCAQAGADARAQYDKVMEVLERAKKLDITEIGLVTKRAGV